MSEIMNGLTLAAINKWVMVAFATYKKAFLNHAFNEPHIWRPLKKDL